MARRRKILTKDDLLHRYATVKGLTYGEAHDMHHATDIEELRTVVETAEETPREPLEVQRAEFIKATQTTTVKGEVR